MGNLNRVYFVLVAIFVLAVFYLSSGVRTPPLKVSGNGERQAIWAEIEPDRPLDKDWLPKYKKVRPIQEPLANFVADPFPLGKDHIDDGQGAKSKNVGFNEDVFDFQKDLPLRQPQWDLERFMRYRPHHWAGRGKPTYATYFCSRNSSVHDPYFLAAQQLVYRVLWDPRSKSRRYPFTVFVAPFISNEQRELFAAAGAIVRQIDLVPWNPTVKTWGRWRDLFSKLNMWGQTDFSRITFLDGDAFPIQNIDQIFDLAPHSRCKKELLDKEDLPHADEMCDYTFTGSEVGSYKEINVGVMVFSPNKHMQARLLRKSQRTDEFDNNMAEQAFLNHAFALGGPFPMHFIGHEWNGFFPQPDQEHVLKIVHEKIWAFGDMIPWTKNMFSDTHEKMLQLYESPEFNKMRMRDGLRQ